MGTRRFAFAFLPLLTLPIISMLSTVSNAQFLRQDEARHQAYCRWDSEADRISVIQQDQQKNDPQSKGDVAYIMAHCPPSQQAIDQVNQAERQQQAADYSKYVVVNAVYQANGELQTGGEGQAFGSAQECDRFVVMRMKAVAAQISVTLLGESVLEGNDGSGYVWFGCIHLSEGRTAAYERYINTPMTEQRARTMQRFPNLSD